MACLKVMHQSVPCKGILFDKDGTLLDLMATWGTWAEHVLRGMEEELALIGRGLPGDKAGLLGTRHAPDGKITGYDPKGPLSMATAEETNGILAWQLYTAGVPWNEAMQRVQSIGQDAMNELRRTECARPLPGLLSFLQQCAASSLKLAVVTSDSSETTVEHLKWLGIEEYFHAVVTRDDVAHGKPHPEMAETACRQLGLEPGETVIIGDSNADMQMGKGAGLGLTVGICAQGGGKEHLMDADIVISDYHALSIIP